MVQINDELKSRGLKTRMIMQVHDELVFEVPTSEEDLVAPLVRDLMTHSFKLDVPIEVDLAIGTNWADMRKISA
jgi:DNA polymerase-1